MKQKIYEFHFEVEVNGGMKDVDFDAIINKVEHDGFTVKQISTCYSDKQYQSKKEYEAYIHIFLLAEEF